MTLFRRRGRAKRRGRATRSVTLVPGPRTRLPGWWSARGVGSLTYSLVNLPLNTYSILNRDMENAELPTVIRALRRAGWEVRGVEDLEGTEPAQVTLFPGDAFHVRRAKPGSRQRVRQTLRPRCPGRNALPGEARRPARVCLAPSPGAALAALGLQHLGHEEPQEIHIYTNEAVVEGLVPTPLLVPDAEDTGEVWSLTGVRVTLVKVVPAGHWRNLTKTAGDLYFTDYKAAREGAALCRVRDWLDTELEALR